SVTSPIAVHRMFRSSTRRASVSLTVSGLPAGVTATFDESGVPQGATSNLTLSIDGGVAPGGYPFALTRSHGNVGHGHSIPLVLLVDDDGAVVAEDLVSAQNVAVSVSGKTAAVSYDFSSGAGFSDVSTYTWYQSADPEGSLVMPLDRTGPVITLENSLT